MSRWAAPAPSCGPLLVHQLTTSTSWVVAGMEATAPPLLAQMSPAGQVTALLEERRQGRAGQGKHLGEQTWLNAAVSLLWDGDAAQQFLAYVARENITFQAWGTQVFCYRILQCNTWPADLDLVHGLLLLLFKYESNSGFSFPRVYHKPNCRVRAI